MCTKITMTVGSMLLRCSLWSYKEVISKLTVLPVVLTKLVPLSRTQQGCQFRHYCPGPFSVGLSITARHPLRGEKARQFLTSDEETIVCVHPTTPVDLSSTKPLRPSNPAVDQLRNELTYKEAEFAKKLRSQDPSLWTIPTLARLFGVKRTAVSKVAPADERRKEELDREKEILQQMKPYKRSAYLTEQGLKRRKRLQQVITENNYKFPGSVFSGSHAISKT